MFDDFQVPNVVLIAAVEITVVLFVICLILVHQNRSLRSLTKRLKGRLEQIITDLKKSSSSAPPAASSLAPLADAKAESYANQISNQIDITRDHHESLNPPQDIILDLAPESPISRRAAALRYVVLLAEKEAVVAKENNPDWGKLCQKYEQIFSFYEDYQDNEDTNEQAEGFSEEVEALNGELINAKKRINNLERFKALYFDLEEKWQEAKNNAEVHYQDLSEMASNVQDPKQFEEKLGEYHASYDSINAIVEGGVEGSTITDVAHVSDSDTAGEIRHLRSVTADQHQIITKLEKRLRNAESDEERIEIVNNLQGELQKQSRFIQESETCIQLMEDELHNANKDIEQLKSRLHILPQLKTELKETRELKDEYELKMYALKTENSKLNKRMKGAQNGSSEMDGGEFRKLKKHINEMETQYAELEEKYLDLKLQHT